MILKILNNYKHAGKALRNIKIYLRLTSNKYLIEKNDQYAFVNFDKRIMNQSGGRFVFIICKYLEDAGFKIVIKTNFYFFLKLSQYKEWLLKRSSFNVRVSDVPLNSILLKKGANIEKIIFLKLPQFKSKNKADWTLPFPMHPVQVIDYKSGMLTQFRNANRTINIFFAGNNHKKGYSAEGLSKQFNVLSRYDVINYLQYKLDSGIPVKNVKEKSELYNLLNEDVRTCGLVISEVKTEDADWLKFLSLSDFFIAPPGYRYPWCHNSVEAMGVGTIPILQYADLFFPKLEHNKNCLLFTNYAELHEAVKIASTMTAEEISVMKKNVIDYFERYLAPDAIVRKIKKFSESNQTQVDVSIPYIM